MDQPGSNSVPPGDPPPTSLIDPAWEKWRNEQVQTISTILSQVFKVEDEVRQSKAPSRLLRTRHSTNDEQEICEKLKAIRQQISEYEQVLQLSIKRIDKALQVVRPPEPVPETPEDKPTSRLKEFIRWVRQFFHDS
ncbi:MAG: hypothetical protein JSS10_07215 [Verrucomicrobia bacterium]|nr:hypothetical protein [Verrucomicrobiota bacterium]